MYPDDRQYSKEHEWIKMEGDRGTVGITDYAQKQLGDVVYVELPDVGAKLTANEVFGTIEYSDLATGGPLGQGAPSSQSSRLPRPRQLGRLEGLVRRGDEGQDPHRHHQSSQLPEPGTRRHS